MQKKCQLNIITCDRGTILTPADTIPEDKEQTTRLHRRFTTQNRQGRNAHTSPPTVREKTKRDRSTHPTIVYNTNETHPKRPRIHIRITETSEQAVLEQSEARLALQTKNFRQFRNIHEQTTRAANAALEAATAAADANSAATAAASAAANAA